MNNDMDAQFLCKDCSRFNLCRYYDRRKENSYICKYFHLNNTVLDKIRADIELLKADGLVNMDAVLSVIDRYRKESEE